MEIFPFRRIYESGYKCQTSIIWFFLELSTFVKLTDFSLPIFIFATYHLLLPTSTACQVSMLFPWNLPNFLFSYLFLFVFLSNLLNLSIF